MTRQMTPLRQRMIEDMPIRDMSPNTQKSYVAAVANFSIFHGRSPDKLTFEDVRDYRLRPKQRRRCHSTGVFGMHRMCAQSTSR